MSKQKVKPATSIIKEATGKDPGPFKSVRVSVCAPNDWNPNKMDPATRDKLVRGIKMLRDQGAEVPPIILRRHPDKTVARYQIIDGFHRWDIYRAEGIERINAFIINVDTKTAMILTDTLNYLRGDPAPDDYAEYFRRLITETQTPISQLGELVHKNPDEIEAILEAYDIDIEHIDIAVEHDGDGRGDDTDDPFIEVKFVMSRSQQEVVEREISRIGALLNGKNIRGRALEFMAVNSSHTELDNLMGEGVADVPKDKLSNLKKKMKAKAS